jgi:hypothetical protein
MRVSWRAPVRSTEATSRLLVEFVDIKISSDDFALRNA